MVWGAVIVAAGRGTRFGRPKQLVEIAGVPMLAWSVRAFARMPEIAEIVVVTEREWMRSVLDVATPAAAGKPLQVVPGGASRQESVRAGLHALSPACTAVLVHDGARPLVRADHVRAALSRVGPGQATLLAVPVVDTVKIVDRQTLAVHVTPDRDALWSAQTPQCAMRADLERAHESALRDGMTATDDAALLERIGVTVSVVMSSPENFKVTLPEDLERAQTLMQARLCAAGDDR